MPKFVSVKNVLFKNYHYLREYFENRHLPLEDENANVVLKQLNPIDSKSQGKEKK